MMNSFLDSSTIEYVDEVLVQQVILAMLGMQRASWEQGVAAQALLEWQRSKGPHHPDYNSHIPLVSMCYDAVTRQDPETGRLSVALNGGDSSSLDPASMVEPLLTVHKERMRMFGNSEFEDAARKQINFLMEKAPRTAKGILSHRMDKVQLWADGIYMGPPALAFAGVHWGERSLITEAVRQIKGYREALWDEGSKLFSHIWDETSQSFERKAHWGVGNGWALAGITRVLLLLPEDLRIEREELLAYVKEGLDGVLAHKRQDDLYHNILDDPSTFIETNAGQQIAYTTFRLAKHGLIDETYIKIAEEFRRAVLEQIDGYGIVRGVCGSPTFDHSGTATEGQAFYVLMEAAYEDYCKARYGEK